MAITLSDVLKTEVVRARALPVCPRCQEAHRNVTFYRLSSGIVLGNGQTVFYWAMCDTTGDPILGTWEMDGAGFEIR